MNRSSASAAVLGTSAALAAAFLAQSARIGAEQPAATAIATPAQHAHAAAAMRALVREHTAPQTDSASPSTRPISVAVCHDCNASRALVQVLLRRHAHGPSLAPLLIFADRSWPTLDTLVRHTQSTMVVTSSLATQVGITPVAMITNQPTIAVGVPDVLDFVAAVGRTTTVTTTVTTTGITP